MKISVPFPSVREIEHRRTCFNRSLMGNARLFRPPDISCIDLLPETRRMARGRRATIEECLLDIGRFAVVVLNQVEKTMVHRGNNGFV